MGRHGAKKIEENILQIRTKGQINIYGEETTLG
jgi:hypothetical protein